MCGCDLGHYHVCIISRQSARWFRAIPSRPTQSHYSPEWPLVSLVSLSLGYQVEQTLASPVWISLSIDLAMKRLDRRRSMWSSGMEQLKDICSALRYTPNRKLITLVSTLPPWNASHLSIKHLANLNAFISDPWWQYIKLRQSDNPIGWNKLLYQRRTRLLEYNKFRNLAGMKL